MIFFGGSSPNASWKRTSRHRAFRKGMSLLRTKSSDNVSTTSAVGQTSDRPGRVNGSHGLVAIVIPSRQKIPAGRLALGLPWLVAQMVKNGKESACNVGDLSSIPGLGKSPGKSPGEGNGHPLQYSCLDNPMDRRAR